MSPTGSIAVYFVVDSTPSMAGNLRAFEASLPAVFAELQAQYADVKVGLIYFQLAFNGEYAGKFLTSDLEAIKTAAFFQVAEPAEGYLTDAGSALELVVNLPFAPEADVRKIIMLADSAVDANRVSPRGDGTTFDGFVKNAIEKDIDVALLNMKPSGTEPEYATYVNAVGGTLYENVSAAEITDIFIDELTSQNTLPVANNDTAVTDEDTAVTIDVLANDTDSDADTLTIESVTDGVNGTATIVNNTLVYTPNADFSGTDSLTYVVSDGKGGTATATVDVTVSAVNDVPVANNDTAVTDEDTAVTIDVLANDTDSDADTLTIESVTDGANGTATIVDNTLVYIPNADFSGTDSLTYVVSDGKGGTATATVDITITAVNDGLTAVDDSLSATNNITLNGNILENDSTDNDGTLKVTAINGAASNMNYFYKLNNGGYVQVNSSGALIFNTGNDFNDLAPEDIRTTSFEYDVSDGSGETETATVTIAVKGAKIAIPEAEFTITGTDEADKLNGTNAADTVNAKNGDDVVTASRGNDIVFGGEGNDSIYGQRKNDTLFGEAGDDTLSGGFGRDYLSGGEGYDSIFGGRQNDVIDGGNGNDHLSGGQGNDIILGGDGDDTILGGARNDTLEGEAGDDYIHGGRGLDFIYGGEGRDHIFGGRQADTLDGGSGDDCLYGGHGYDDINGGIGNDIINGGIGQDTLAGGDGADIFDYDDLLDSVTGFADVISDFTHGDTIDLSDLGVSYDNVSIQQYDADTTSVKIADTSFEIHVKSNHLLDVDDFVF